jgi:hypothetical protein
VKKKGCRKSEPSQLDWQVDAIYLHASTTRHFFHLFLVYLLRTTSITTLGRTQTSWVEFLPAVSVPRAKQGA